MYKIVLPKGSQVCKYAVPKLIIKCTQQKKPKCYNCGMEHPANHRGCTVTRKLLYVRNKAIQPNALFERSS